MINFLVFFFGIIIGSFLNVIIYRLPRNENIAFPASKCPNCDYKIKFYENIPLLSFFLLKGRCAKCKIKISYRYPFVEFVTGIFFLLVFMKYSFTYYSIIYFLFIAVLIIIFFIDLEHYIIPDSMIFAIFILALANSFILKEVAFTNAIISAITTFIFFYLIFILSNGKFGGGDVKFFTALAFFFGWPYINFLIIISSIVGLVFGVILIVFKKINRSQPIPFGPFIVFSASMILLYGDDIWKLFEKIIPGLVL